MPEKRQFSSFKRCSHYRGQGASHHVTYVYGWNSQNLPVGTNNATAVAERCFQSDRRWGKRIRGKSGLQGQCL